MIYKFEVSEFPNLYESDRMINGAKSWQNDRKFKYRVSSVYHNNNSKLQIDEYEILII